jgi:hypothetical protein
MKVRIVLAVLLAVLGGSLWWQAAHPAGPSAETIASPDPSTAPASPVAAPVPVPASPSSSVSEGLPTSQDSMSPAEQREVVAFAGRFAAAFARPAGRTDYRAWWRSVASMMTDEAVSDFLGTDPSEVPYTKVTGPITLLDGGDAEAYWLQRVQVPTDAGVFVLQIQMVTPGLSDRLLVSGVEFP